MSDFNNFDVNQQDGQFGSTPGDQNNFGGNFGGSGDNFGGNFGGNTNNGLSGDPNGNFGGNTNNGFGTGVTYNTQQNSGINISLWKTLSIIQIILGCCNGLAPMACGIVSLVFMNAASNAMNMGDMMTANNKFKTGKIWNIVGWCLIGLGIIINILSLVLGLAEGIFTAFSGQ